MSINRSAQSSSPKSVPAVIITRKRGNVAPITARNDSIKRWKRVVKRLMVKRYKFRSFVIECGAKNRGGALGSTTRRKVWHFWTAFSFRGPRPPGNGLLIPASSPGTRCFRVAARTARFTCPEFYCILPVDSMTTRDLNTVGPCRLFASLFCFFFKFRETRNSLLPSLHFYDTWRYNFDRGGFFFFNEYDSGYSFVEMEREKE